MEIIILVSTQCQYLYLHTLNTALVHYMDFFTKGIFFLLLTRHVGSSLGIIPGNKHFL